MQATVIDAHGPAAVLVHRSVPDPTPPPGWVVVELKAAALNRRDVLVRSGAGNAYRFDLPLILGSDGAGIRRDTGEEVVINPALEWGGAVDVPGPGFRVLGGPENGTYAELVAVPAENLYPRPRCLSWHEAAGLTLAGLTAYRALFTIGRLQRGEHVVVLGAGSGLSLAAIQLARHAGARVSVTSSSPDKLERAAVLGSSAGVRYDQPDWASALADAAGPADMVLDAVGTTWPGSLQMLRPGGRVVSCGGTGGSEVTVDIRSLYLSHRNVLGSMMGSTADFRAMIELARDGALRPVVDSVHRLDEAATAHERIESGQHCGKIVLAV